jgi:hypothetical protein
MTRRSVYRLGVLAAIAEWTSQLRMAHHAFLWNPRARRGRGRAAVEFGDFVGVRVPRRAVERRQLSNQLRNRHAEFRGPRFKHVGGVPVDVDADVRSHDARIANSRRWRPSRREANGSPATAASARAPPRLVATLETRAAGTSTKEVTLQRRQISRGGLMMRLVAAGCNRLLGSPNWRKPSRSWRVCRAQEPRTRMQGFRVCVASTYRRSAATCTTRTMTAK